MRDPAADSSRIDARTQLCAVIGNPVTHSLSPLVHNAAFRECGLNFAYAAFPVDDVAGAIRGIRALGIRGVSVTLPHKVAVIEHLDALDPAAERIGSVNTIVNRDGRLIGSTADGLGALRALREAGTGPSGKRVLIVGAGGAARAIAMTIALERGAAGIHILARDPRKAARLASEVTDAGGHGAEAGSLDGAVLSRALAEADILIHTTPVGMVPAVDECLVEARWLRPDITVLDIVYTPLETELARRAGAAGARVVSGLEMFVHQASAQFETWTGAPAPVAVMRRVALEQLVR